MEGLLSGLKDSLRGAYLIFHYDSDIYNRHTSSKSLKSSRFISDPNTRRGLKVVGGSTLKNEYKVLPRVLKCCLLNGVIYGMSLVLFHLIFLPILGAIFGLFLDNETATRVWGIVQPTLTLLFQTFWVLPIFIISRVINTVWFQDIADSAYRQRQGRPQFFSSISKLFADTILSVYIQFLFLMQTSLMTLVPIVGVSTILSSVHMSLLNSLYSFEYRWCNMAWPLDKRLKCVEDNWPYFLGFGLPLSLVTLYPSSVLVSGCLFAVLFPIFIISANEAAPVMNTSRSSLPLFAGVVWLSSQSAQFLFSPKTDTHVHKGKPTTR